MDALLHCQPLGNPHGKTLYQTQTCQVTPEVEAFDLSHILQAVRLHEEGKRAIVPGLNFPGFAHLPYAFHADFNSDQSALQ